MTASLLAALACGAVVLGDVVHLHNHVWERGHESTGPLGDRCAADGRSTAIDADYGESVHDDPRIADCSVPHSSRRLTLLEDVLMLRVAHDERAPGAGADDEFGADHSGHDGDE